MSHPSPRRGEDARRADEGRHLTQPLPRPVSPQRGETERNLPLTHSDTNTSPASSPAK